MQEVKACSACRTAWYCSKECQRAHWRIHRPICRPYSPNEVWGIKLLCKGDLAKLKKKSETGDERRFRHILVNTNHPIFFRGELCPVTALAGIPLLIYSLAFATGRFEEGGNNQPAVYLRIEADTFAPLQWLDLDPGTCIIVRQDRKPLTRATIETIWRFTAKVIEGAGYPACDGWAPIRSFINPTSFQFFSRAN